MKLFVDRPLATMAATFVAVSVAAFYVSGIYKLWTAVLAVIIAVIVFILSLIGHGGRVRAFAKAHRTHIAGISLAAVLAALVSYAYMDVWYASVRARDGDEAEVNGYVTDTVYESSYGSGYRVTVTHINGKRQKLGAILELPYAGELSVGDEFSADVEFAALGIEGSFDEEAYYLPRGVVTSIEVDDAESLEVTGKHDGFDVSIAKLRRRISAILSVTMDGIEDHGIPEAIFIGQRGALDDDVSRDFRYIGASHMLAVSGLHLTVLIGGIEAMLIRLRLKKSKNIILIFLTIAYMALTGFSASVARAGIMLIIYYLSDYARRGPDGVTSLFVAAAIIMLISPASAADTGLFLSITAMLGCLFSERVFIPDRLKEALKAFRKRGKFCRRLANAFRRAYGSAAISVAAMMFTLPVMWAAFGRVSLLSPLSTLLLLLPVKWILYLCPLMVLTFRLVPLSSSCIASLCGLLCRMIAWISSSLAGIGGTSVSLSGEFPFAAIGCLIITVCLVTALVLGRRGARRSVSAAIAVFVLVAITSGVYFSVYDAEGVDYVNYLKSDGFIVNDGRRVLICDISDGAWTAASLFVTEAASERVDVYMMTHLHSRHIRTFKRLCRREYVGEVWLPMPESDDEAEVYASICDAAERYGVTVFGYERGDTLSFGSTDIETVPRTMIKRSTHPIVAVAFASGAGRTVYIGSSVHESRLYEYAVDMCHGADEVVFGIHGPVYKGGASYHLGDGVRVMFATAEVADYLLDYNQTDGFLLYGE